VRSVLNHSVDDLADSQHLSVDQTEDIVLDEEAAGTIALQDESLGEELGVGLSVNLRG